MFVVSLNKGKLGLLSFGSLAFAIAGTLFIINPEGFVSPVMRSTVIIFFIGVLAFLFFGMTTIFGFKMLFDSRPGLIIDEEGITDNSNGTSVGLVPWEDIKRIETVEIASLKFIVVKVKNPQKYIRRGRGKVLRSLMEQNRGAFGSPIHIIPMFLKLGFDELEECLNREFQKRIQ